MDKIKGILKTLQEAIDADPRGLAIEVELESGKYRYPVLVHVYTDPKDDPEEEPVTERFYID
jgi:hypothetical protein